MLDPCSLMICFLVLELLHMGDSVVTSSNSTRRLADEIQFKLKDMKKQQRTVKTIELIESTSSIPSFFKPDPGSPPHQTDKQAVFAAAMGPQFGRFEALMFVGNLRDTGYTGDIVLAIDPNSNAKFISTLKEYAVITYTVDLTCQGPPNDRICSFTQSEENTPKVSINMIRYYMYQWWARKYEPDALIMLSDFKDVFFQSNPFTYRTYEWAPPVAQFVVFQEPYPNKVINRCVFNGGWVKECYGVEGLNRIGSNTVSCSGVSIGTRDAVIIYSYLITQQLDPRVRYGRKTTKTNKGCISLGMDQGFHNWLVYSGQLEKYMDIKIYQQGEGPVNTIGGFFGERILLKFPLEKWQVLRGEKGKQRIHNWNGDPSPAVHQGDRFLLRDLGAQYENLLIAQKPIREANK